MAALFLPVVSLLAAPPTPRRASEQIAAWVCRTVQTILSGPGRCRVVFSREKSPGVKFQIVFYSLYGHVYRMAEAVAEGARKEPGTQVELFQVAETLPQAVLEKMGAVEAKKAFAHIPIANPQHLAEADAVILGTGTRFGGATAQMQAFLDSTGSHWQSGGRWSVKPAASSPQRQASMADRRRPSSACRPFFSIRD